MDRHDVGEHVKGAVQNVTHELENVLGGKKDNKSDHVNEDDGHEPATNGHDGGDNPDYQIIRLKGSKQNSVEETEKMENAKNDLLTKAQSFGDDTDRMADDLMKETEELMRDAETGIAHSEMTTRITSNEDGTIEILNLEGNAPKSPNHSIDSLQTTSPEPEIERILAGAGTEEEGTAPDSPKATLNTLSVPAVKEEGMPMDAMPPAADKADVQDTTQVWPIPPQISIDGESVTSSEEYFRMEVQKATSTHTPGRTVARRPINLNRPPPPSTAASDRVQRFIFKLNSIILSDIEERMDEDGSIVRQLERNPDRVVELLSKSSLEDDEEVDGAEVDGGEEGADETTGAGVTTRKGRRKMPHGIRRQQSMSVEETTDPTMEHPSNECAETQQNALNLDDQQQLVLLRDIPPAVRLRALMRFKSLDSSTTDGTMVEMQKHKARRRRMKSLDTIAADDENEGEEQESAVTGEERDQDTLTDMSYDPEEEERICEELLAELRALEEADRAEAEGKLALNENELRSGGDVTETGDQSITIDHSEGDGHKTAWEKLQDYLQRVPKRRSSNYDLFYENDEEMLKTLFKRTKLKQMFHYSESSSGSSDDTM
uniref:Uncharacterized protein n=1 Tax=Anopheles arabiensis TaxID=7173 RepID=A0A182HMH6_ANOAR